MGSNEENCRINLIKWETICRPKTYGGLGLQRIKDYNAAFMMKLAWGLITKPNSLWVTLLHAKYMKSMALIPDTMEARNCSYLWKHICRVLVHYT